MGLPSIVASTVLPKDCASQREGGAEHPKEDKEMFHKNTKKLLKEAVCYKEISKV